MGQPSTIGIDLGTSNSCVVAHLGKRPEIIRNLQGNRTTPSVVTYRDDGGVLVGEPAQRQAITNPARTISGVKRLVGRRFESPEVALLRRLAPYDIVPALNGDAWVRVDERSISPPEVQSHILEQLRDAAQQFLGGRITRAVITVPAFFDETQRQATRDAALIAGLEPVRILAEPTAAALAYGYADAREKTLAVVDLGGGTFDVSIMRVEGGRFQVLGTSGDMLLGGEDFDRAIAARMVDEIRDQHGVDVSGNPIALQRLIGEAEIAKKALSEVDSAHLRLPYLATGADGAIDYERTLRRAELAELIGPLIARLAGPCQKALADAGVSAAEIDDVILVGGMTRNPSVRDQAERIFGRRPSLRINPDEAVAIGAAVLSGALDGRVAGVDFVDVSAHSIGLRAAGDRFVPLIPRATQLPASSRKGFATTRDQQPNLELEVYEGEAERASQNRKLSSIAIEGLPAKPAGEVKIAVTFDIDADGSLTVGARILGSADESRVIVEPASGLTPHERERLIRERAANRTDPDTEAAIPALDPAASGGFSIDFTDPATEPPRQLATAKQPALARPAAARPERPASHPAAPPRAASTTAALAGLAPAAADPQAIATGAMPLVATTPDAPLVVDRARTGDPVTFRDDASPISRSATGAGGTSASTAEPRTRPLILAGAVLVALLLAAGLWVAFG